TGARHYLKDLYPYFDDSRSSPLVQATIRGSKKVRGDPIHRKPPLRTSHIQFFVDKATQTQKYDDLLFATIIACAFYGCHRTGELVVPNRKALRDWRKIIKRSTLRFDGGRAGYHLPYHKADPFYRGTEILFTAQEALGRWSSTAWKIYIRDNPSVRAEQELAQLRLNQLAARIHLSMFSLCYLIFSSFCSFLSSRYTFFFTPPSSPQQHSLAYIALSRSAECIWASACVVANPDFSDEQQRLPSQIIFIPGYLLSPG
ncbi:hypothetical protein K435DRAFT_644919, partial [Dendrothele bispora CBS 962.96]